MNKLRYLLWVFLLISMSAFSESQKSFQKKIEAHRAGIDQKFKDPKVSPLKDKANTYKGQNYYKPDKSYRIKARLERTPESKPFKLPTSNPSRQKNYVQYGVLHFQLKGKELQLHVYKDLQLSNLPQYKNHLFLPFADLTSGNSTYGGGRYMDLEIPKRNKLILDFNLCYNPYCAYSEGWSCPIIPRENFLNIAIEAGVKKYHK